MICFRLTEEQKQEARKMGDTWNEDTAIRVTMLPGTGVFSARQHCSLYRYWKRYVCPNPSHEQSDR